MLMGHELVRGDAQDAIEARARKRGMTPFLPPSVPFVSQDRSAHRTSRRRRGAAA
jgi:hypothetical protein